jgi:hypothetical protein
VLGHLPTVHHATDRQADLGGTAQRRAPAADLRLRLIVCRNRELAAERTRKREELLAATSAPAIFPGERDLASTAFSS